MTRQALTGFTLIEVLVTVLIVAIGLLGLAALQVNTLNKQFETLQRAQVTSMVEDMTSRIRMNPTEAKSGAYYGSASGTNCASLSGADRDLCEWNAMMATLSIYIDVDTGETGLSQWEFVLQEEGMMTVVIEEPEKPEEPEGDGVGESIFDLVQGQVSVFFIIKLATVLVFFAYLE